MVLPNVGIHSQVYRVFIMFFPNFGIRSQAYRLFATFLPKVGIHPPMYREFIVSLFLMYALFDKDASSSSM
jgi:hypothetical protein